MEMFVFNQVIFDSLMPWLVNTSDIHQMRECLRRISAKEPETQDELQKALSELLSFKPQILQWLSKQKQAAGHPLQQLSYSTVLPEHTDIPTKYYKTLIEYESLRIYTAYIALSDKYQEDEDLLVYHTINTLRNLKHYIRAASLKIRENKFKHQDVNALTLTPFVLYYFKYKLIALYFSIQLVNRDLLNPVWDLNDFYLLELEETAADVHPIMFEAHPVKFQNTQSSTSKTLSFGFKGDVSNLANLINVLCTQINLLDEQITKPATLIQVLTANDVYKVSSKVKFGCNTNVVTYIFDCLKRKLPKLTYSNIDSCGLFFTNRNKPIRQSLLSNSKSNNELSDERKEAIDKIFKENHI